jgi:hypothetical protein
MAWLREQPSARVRVQRVSTPLSPSAMRDALSQGHFAAFDVYPSSARLRMACAQMGVEHGLDGHGVHTYCLGNIMRGKGYMGPWFEMSAREKIDGVERNVISRWRASADGREGAAGWWARMSTKYPGALDSFARGDPVFTAHELKREGYYTADESDYSRLLTSCWRAVA